MSIDPVQAPRKELGPGSISPKNPKGNRFLPNDFLRLRQNNQLEQPDQVMQIAAGSILRLSWFDKSFAASIRQVFDAIPHKALEIEAGASELKSFGEALKIALALVVHAAMGGRSDLHHIIKTLHKGVLAVDDRLRGVDEPFFRAGYDPKSPREDDYVRCVKTWCAMAGHALVAMGTPKNEAAKSVAGVVNGHGFLQPKANGISVVPRSVMKWMARWDNGDLKALYDPWQEFADAFEILNQGRPLAARHKLLKVLADRLNERKSFRSYPGESSSALFNSRESRYRFRLLHERSKH